MATAFIDKFKDLCGRSNILAILIAINIVLGVLLSITLLFAGKEQEIEFNLHRMLALSSNFSVFIVRPWTILTYMVTQFSILHLLFNTIWLIWFGRLTIFALGEKALLPLYLGGGITGGILYITSGLAGIVSPGASLCGASASALALMTAIALTIPDYKVNLWLIGEVKMKWFCIGCILLSLIGLGGAGGSYGGQMAHIGGVAFGFCYVFLRKYNTVIPLRNKGNRKSAGRKMNPSKVICRANGRLNDTARLDQLLEKISISGYSSLSIMEKKELDAISKHLKNRDKTDSN